MNPNNAPIVAMMTPLVIDWAKRNHLSPSRFLIPLSYASILGSLTTIIGTSTNLTVAGLIIEADRAAWTLVAIGVILATTAFLIRRPQRQIRTR